MALYQAHNSSVHQFPSITKVKRQVARSIHRFPIFKQQKKLKIYHPLIQNDKDNTNLKELSD